MGETEDEFRRKDDVALGKFIGEIEQWKEESLKWREETDGKLKEIIDFMQEVRTPRKIILWTVRAFFVALVGGLITTVTAWIKGHVNFQ